MLSNLIGGMKMKVVEIFSSLQGEGKYTGYPTTFIRFYGCVADPLCKYCDSKYACEGKNYSLMSLDKIMLEVSRLGNKYVCLTGGEPLLQDDIYPLIYELLSFSYIVSVETSGLIDIDNDEYSRSYNYVMDIKCPCSGIEEFNKYNNLSILKSYDEVKFVIADEDDIEFVKKVLKKYPTKAGIILSPVNNNISAIKLITKELISGNIKGKIGIQLHKFLGVK